MHIIFAEVAAEDLRGAVCDDLVRVHVVTRPRARLKRLDDELRIPFAVHHFGRGLRNRISQLFRGKLFSVHLAVVEETQFKIHGRRRAFDRRNRPDECAPRAESADGEVLHRALGLHAEERVCWHIEFAERIFFFAKFF